MKKLSFLLSLFIYLVSFNAKAQNITAIRSLSFGTLLKPTIGTNWLHITAVADNPAITGNAVRLGSSVPITAQFYVASSKARQYYAITLPTSITLRNSYNDEIIIDQLAHSYGTGNGRTSPQKEDNFYVGGRINLSSDIKGGSFAGTINVQIDFL